MSPAASWFLVLLWIVPLWWAITRYDRRDYTTETPSDVAYVDRLALDSGFLDPEPEQVDR